MKSAIQKLSAASEFALVMGLAFGLPIAAAVYSMVLERTRVTATDGGLVQLGIFEIVSLGLVAWVLRTRGRSVSELDFTPNVANTLRGFALLAGSILAYWGAALLVGGLTGSFDFLYGVRLYSTASLSVVVATSLLNPFFEETLVVAYVVGALRAYGMVPAVGASAIIRLSYHLYQGPIAIVGILPLGIILAAYYWRRPSLWPLMVAHALGDLIGLLATAAR